MIRLLDAADELRPRLARIRSTERLVRFHDELAVWDQGNDWRNDYEIFEDRSLHSRPFNMIALAVAPPVPPPDWMRPLQRWWELDQESDELNHCLRSYRFEIEEGNYYAYAVDHPEHGRATLGIRRSGRHWRVAELRGKRNALVSRDLTAEVRRWIQSTPPREREPHPTVRGTAALDLPELAEAREPEPEPVPVPTPEIDWAETGDAPEWAGVGNPDPVPGREMVGDEMPF